MPTTRSATKQVKLDEFKDDQNNMTSNEKVGAQAKMDSIDVANVRSTVDAPQDKNKNKRKADSDNQTTTTTTIPPKKTKQSQVNTTQSNTTASRGRAESTEGNKTNKQQSPTAESTNSNRRSNKQQNPPKQQQQALSTTNINTLERPILINRSPVLQLWGATVAQFLHPSLSWSTCLSAGNAVSALCAVAKGQAIGVIPRKARKQDADNDDNGDDDGDNDDNDDDSHDGGSETRPEEKTRKSNNDGGENDDQNISVMGFPMFIGQNEIVMISEKSKALREETLMAKFGGNEEYERVKRVMRDNVETWKGHEDELNSKAFRMYEKFRPQAGWGKKGELNVHEIESVVKKESEKKA